MNDKSAEQNQNNDTVAELQESRSLEFLNQEPSTQTDSPNPSITPPQTRSKWRSFFMGFLIVICLVQILGVVMFSWAMADLSSGAETDGSSAGFVALIVYAMIVPVVAVAALINLIGLPIFMYKYRLKRTGIIFSSISLLISLPIFLFGVYVVYQMFGYTLYHS